MDYSFIGITLISTLTRSVSTSRIDTAIWMHYLDANLTAEEEARRQLHKNTLTIRPPASHHENYTS